jgi:hypothetical protein
MYPSGPLIRVDCHCCEVAATNVVPLYPPVSIMSMDDVFMRLLINVDCRVNQRSTNVVHLFPARHIDQ